MHRRLLSALAAACLLGITGTATSAATATYTLTMDRDPAGEGWRPYGGDLGDHYSAADGLLHVDAPGVLEFFAPAEAWVDRASNAAGWTVEARLRRDPSSTGTPGMWIGDDRFVTIFGLSGSGIELGDDSAFVGRHAVDTSMFHTYRLVGLRDSLAVFVDDVFALSLDAVGSPGGTFAFAFGDNNRFTYLQRSVADWDYVSLTTTPGPRWEPPSPSPVPLPAGIWLLGSGVLAFGGVALRRHTA